MPTADEVWRDYVVDGVPSSGRNNPQKAEIRSWATDLETSVAGTLDSITSLLALGLKRKAPVDVATTTAGTLATDFEDGGEVDGVTLATGDRILIKDQADAKENGIYVVEASGAPSRADDADTDEELLGAAVFVQSGDDNAGRTYACINPTAPEIGTDNILFELADARITDWVTESAGEEDAGKLTALDADGKLDFSMMPAPLRAIETDEGPLFAVMDEEGKNTLFSIENDADFTVRNKFIDDLAARVSGFGLDGKLDFSMMPNELLNLEMDEAPLYAVMDKDGINTIFSIESDSDFTIRNRYIDSLAAKVSGFVPRRLLSEGNDEGPLFSIGDTVNSIFSVEPDGTLRSPWADQIGRYAKAAAPAARVYIDGDSRSDLGSNHGRTRAQGWIGWLQTFTGARFDFLDAWNNGVQGQDSGEMLNRSGNLVGLEPGTVICICSTNERTGSGQTADWTIERLAAYQARVLSLGHRLIWLAEMPRGDNTNTSYTLSSTQLAYHNCVRQWLLDQGSVRNVHVVDPWKVMADPTRTDGRALDTMMRDGIHWGAFGAFHIAKLIQPVIETLLPPRDVLPATNSDLYSANNPLGSLNPNPMVSGTGGMAGTGCTGDVADDWTAVAGAGLACTCSKVTDDDGKVWQRGVVSGGATGNDITDSIGGADISPVSVIFEADLDDAEIDEGDVLQAVCEVHVEAGATGLRGVSLWIEYTTDDGNVLTCAMEPDVIRSQINLDIPDEEWSGVLMTQPTDPIEGTVTSARVYLAISGAEWSSSARSVSATVDFRAVKTRKL